VKEKRMSIYRSFLFAPGNHARRVEKCVSVGADAVILDLEDAVANAEKPSTRQVIVAALAQPRRCKGYVRVNALSTEWCYGDLVAVIARGVDGIVLPKVESASDLLTVDWLVRSLEKEQGLPEGGIDIMPIVETAVGFSNLAAIARSRTRVKRIAFGAGDFTLDLGISWSDDENELLPYRTAFVVESRAARLEPPIDTVWVKLKDADAFERSARRARDLGFQGKMCIHPDQVPVANDVFKPTGAEVAQARRVTAAFAEAEAKGLASIQVDGRFVDYPIVYLARRVIARAELIAAAEALAGLPNRPSGDPNAR
jgi:citrate lyase subunit beta/citryl-CoA lyase